MNVFQYKIIAWILLLVLPICQVKAESEVVIENNVSVSASTGNNSAVGEEVIEGSRKSSVKIKTEINGQTVEEIIIEDVNAENDGNKDLKIESKINANEKKADIKTLTEINGKQDRRVNEIILDEIQVRQSEKDVGEVVPDSASKTDNIEELKINEDSEVLKIGPEDQRDASDLAGQDKPAEKVIVKIWVALVENIKFALKKIFTFFA